MEGHGGGGGCSPCLHSLLLFAAFVAVISIGRLFYVLHRTDRPFHPGEAPRRARALIILGSGGHTAEMLNLLEVLDKDKFVPRYYVAAITDSMSLQKAWVFEGSLVQQEFGEEEMHKKKTKKVGMAAPRSPAWTACSRKQDKEGLTFKKYGKVSCAVETQRKEE